MKTKGQGVSMKQFAHGAIAGHGTRQTQAFKVGYVF